MGVGTSLFLIAVGAICTFALTATMRGINLSAVGIILMVIGVLGLTLSALFWESFAPFSGWRRRTTTIEPVVRDVEIR